MKKTLFILLISTLTVTAIYSQGGFSKNYFFNTSLTSVVTDAIEAPNGNLIMVGATYDSLNGQNFYRLTIVGATANGTELWKKSYGKFKFTYLTNPFTSRSVITYSNCFYVYSAAKDSNNKYLSVLIKFNFNGDTLWQKKYYDATDYLYIQSVCKSVDNGFLMTGFFEGTLRTCLLIKTDSTGKELWRKKINKGITPDTQSGYRILQDTLTKKIVIAGYQYQWDGTNPGGFSGYANIIITDSLGTELQRKTYSGACGSGFYDLIQTKDKNFVAVGYKDQCDDLGQRRNKSYVVKLNINNLNVPIWQKEFDITSVYNTIFTIAELNNGNLILGGGLDTLLNYNIPEKIMSRVIKLDKNGTLIWKKYFSKDNIQKNSKTSVGLSKCNNGDIVIASHLSYVYNNRPYHVTRIDSMGCDSTMAYCSTVGINEIKLKTQNLVNIYPNPTNDILTVELFNNNNYEIKIVNLLGQNVINFKTEILNDKIKLNISDLKNGIYFLQLFEKEKLILTEKIIKE